LGLSIAKQIIDKLGENIYVESRPGEGTSFHFTLKNYISNAIALGPVGADVVIQDDGTTVYRRQERGSQDAPYEVIPKRQHEKKSDKGNKPAKQQNEKNPKKR